MRKKRGLEKKQTTRIKFTEKPAIKQERFFFDRTQVVFNEPKIVDNEVKSIIKEAQEGYISSIK